MLWAIAVVATSSSIPVECASHALLASLYGEPSTTSLQDAPNSQSRPDAVRETHLTNVRQLTFGGQNAEAYWSADGEWITYQTRQDGFPDEQIFRMRADGSDKTLVSTGKGRCTCSYFSPDGKQIYFSSTHEKNEGAQPPVDMSQGYVWRVNEQFSLFRRQLDTGEITRVIEKNEYVAETTIDPQGRYMVFTGAFDGDLEIYRAQLDGSGITRLTNEVGYDGGPFVSWDGNKIVYRRDELESEAEVADYKRLLAQHLVRPGRLDVWMMDSDGTNKQRVTNLDGASFAPFIHPNGRQIIFSSNFHDPKGREFDLFLINTDGTGLQQLTFTPEFDGFPMFSKDGKKLLWASNRFGSVAGETNIFVADWIQNPSTETVSISPDNDVWVYEHASNQDQDAFLRTWGGGIEIMPHGQNPDDTISIVQFPPTTITAGEIVEARLVLTHVAPSGNQRAFLRQYPVQAWSVMAGINEKAWLSDLAGDHWPAGPALASGHVSGSDADGNLEVTFDLGRDGELLRKALSGDGLALAIFSPLPVADLGRDAIFKFFSRNAADAKVHPRLEVVVKK
ncbi:MAG: PD40 domain-containing protein [Fimbriimonadaceae bacterium]|nr:PD40 domain-containing protein [Fimbriimonadaceae bacterium]